MGATTRIAAAGASFTRATTFGEEQNHWVSARHDLEIYVRRRNKMVLSRRGLLGGAAGAGLTAAGAALVHCTNPDLAKLDKRRADERTTVELGL